MSWKENLEQVFTITTGDAQLYTVLWTPTSKALEWNMAEFEFPDLDGTLLKKSKAKGRKFPLEFYIQGENHLVTALAFEKSANDNRPWKIAHPYYGDLLVQCPSLNIDHSSENISKFSCTVTETITDDAPKTAIDPVSKITNDKISNDEAFVNAFDIKPSVSDKNLMTSNIKSIYASGSTTVKTPSESEAYFNSFNTANAAIINATSEPLAAARTMQAMITAPALFQNSVESRIKLLKSQFDKLRLTVKGLSSRSGKKIYENNGGALVSSMALAVANPIPGDYMNAVKVLSLVDPILNSYNNYINDLDSLQSLNGGDVTSYIPDASSIIGLNDLINYTLSNLFTIALSAKQERIVRIQDDSNWVLLTHRFYGSDPNDENLNSLLQANDVGLNEMLQVKKGRAVVYYV